MVFEKVGGRKFVLAILAVAVGTAVQILSPNGVNDAFVALLVGITAAFGASNAFVSSKAIGAEASQAGTETDSMSSEVFNHFQDVHRKVNEIDARVSDIDNRANQLADGMIKVAQNVETVGKLAKAAVTVSNRSV